MKILQIASSWGSTPPSIYGPVEQLVSDLTEELKQLGHDVTLFATANSHTSAKLAYELEEGVGEYNQEQRGHFARRHAQAAIAFANAHDFDIVSNHETNYCIPLCTQLKHPQVTRMGWLGDERLKKTIQALTVQEYRRLQFIAVSNRLRQVVPYLHWAGTIYNGRQIAQFPFQKQKEPFLLFLGRMTEEKGPDKAIRIAKETGIPLIMAGVVPAYAQDYFLTHVKPHIDNQHIRWVGPADQTVKRELFAKAMAFLMPITWEEPFGNVMVEAMACGTPVIALHAGSAPEIVAHGKTGFVVHTVEEMIQAVQHLPTIQPDDCREHVEAHFSVQVMARNYIQMYQHILDHQ
ncbi:glycosyltransferase family 4 protein [Tengunoibacter tsumagoiensis]|uniref:Glycosyl transferase n=1 Tax=Tengunoibacter tsumagoiensis TaxID=2014871 RepID=A0A402A778_9CHLR|nr:glycosyltransferase family 4 protein [Tengunoibacter tsumagoiensis]GCE14958.1 glycosyl transferase [Tengunoibacter tsumagoiensis]